MQRKGILPRHPGIPYPEQVEYVHKEGWIKGLTGDRRPIHAAEITHLFMNVMTNCTGQALMMGFSQVAKDKEVIRHLVRGRDIATKHMEVFSSILRDDNLPAPMSWAAEVTDSKTAPFSDKLMLFHTVFLSSLGIGNYGTAMAACARRDVASVYVRLMAEIGTFADDGGELMIRKAWMEKMPGAIERNALLSL